MKTLIEYGWTQSIELYLCLLATKENTKLSNLLFDHSSSDKSVTSVTRYYIFDFLTETFQDGELDHLDLEVLFGKY